MRSRPNSVFLRRPGGRCSAVQRVRGHEIWHLRDGRGQRSWRVRLDESTVLECGRGTGAFGRRRWSSLSSRCSPLGSSRPWRSQTSPSRRTLSPPIPPRRPPRRRPEHDRYGRDVVRRDIDGHDCRRHNFSGATSTGRPRRRRRPLRHPQARRPRRRPRPTQRRPTRLPRERRRQ